MKYKVIKYISEIVCINKKDVTPLDVLIALDLKEKYDFRPSEYYINASGEMVKDRGHCDCGNRDLDNVICYYGYSEHFQEVEDGTIAPEYVVVIHSYKNGNPKYIEFERL